MKKYNSSLGKKLWQKSALTAAFLLQITANRTLAQVIPDQTLGAESSTINSIDQLRSRIEGGATRGENLFHSFSEFNIGEGLSVYFANPKNIANIFSQVTGNNISEILGTLGVEGNANLFFLNPNGIVFGENAFIDIGGSFIATTASTIEFSDGTSFNSRRENKKPLLTWNAPIGLGIDNNPGNIVLNGTGHNFGFNTLEPTVRLLGLSNLTLKPEKTLAFIGGDIALNGGVLVAPDGHIELGAVASGKVFFDSATLNSFKYETSSLKNIQLINESLADVSGFSGGSIHTISNQITLSSGSGFFVQNQIRDQSQTIKVDANSLEISGGSIRPVIIFDRGVIETTADGEFARIGFIDGEFLVFDSKVSEVLETLGLPLEGSEPLFSFVPSFIFSESLQDGLGNNLEVNAQNILISDGAQIITRSFDSADAGKISLDKSAIIEVKGVSSTPGFAEETFEIFSQINSTTFGSGKGGNIELNTNILSLSDRGSINSSTFSTGIGGNLDINVDTLNVVGNTPTFFIPASVATIAFNEGDGGKLIIEAKNIFLNNGGALNNVTYAGGNAGEMRIEATEGIEVSGKDFNTQFPSSISAGAILLPSEIRETFLLPPNPTGDAGSLSISASEIRINNSGVISVENQGTGNAGILSINAETLNLDEVARITAAASSGSGGNIEINTSELNLDNNSQITAVAGGDQLRWQASPDRAGGNITITTDDSVALIDRSSISASSSSGQGGVITINTDKFQARNSNISTSAEGLGNGGNISINSDTALFIGDSDVTATAVQGDGGNILIDADAVLGIEERRAISGNGRSDADASSEFGEDGTVEIKNPLTSANDPIAAANEVDINQKENIFRSACEKGKKLLTDNRHPDYPESPDNFLDTYDHVTSNDFVPPPEPDKLDNGIDPNSIESLLWKPGEPGVPANYWRPGEPLMPADLLVTLDDGRKFTVVKALWEAFLERTHGCIKENVVEIEEF